MDARPYSKNRIFDILEHISTDIQEPPKGNRGTKKRVKYIDCIAAFDIETTRISVPDGSFPDNNSIMYLWQFAFEDLCIYGRYWDELSSLVDDLKLYLPDDAKLVVFVHNLSYEFQFLSGIWDFVPDDVFCLDSRKVCKAIYGPLEFRCSYIHSNMSLDAYLKQMGVEHEKVKGFDYNKVRWPWTPLDDDELLYGITDVVGLVEAVHIEMERDGDDLYSYPLTSTGYVRRDCKAAMRQCSHQRLQSILPDYELYKVLREAFRGGNTHANRLYAGQILHDVHSCDRSSSYPDVICNCLFPIAPFVEVISPDMKIIDRLIDVRGKPLVFRLRLWDVQLINRFDPCPYIARAKCSWLNGARCDNGRVLSADYLEIAVTDIDYKIVRQHYSWSKAIPYACYSSRYGHLPRPLVDTTIQYYKQKTALKNVAGQDYYYAKAKNKLNSIYGMMATDPLRLTITFEDGQYLNEIEKLLTEDGLPDWEAREDLRRRILLQSNHRAFLAYQWGVWTTAWARQRLQIGIDAAGDGFVYCDTDSVKYVGDIDLKQFNESCRQACMESGSWAVDPNGEVHYMGVYEPEKDYKQFITWGSKKYAYINHKGNVQATIAGVCAFDDETHTSGGTELARHGGLPAFKPGFCFSDAGPLQAIYNDLAEPALYTIDGHQIQITRNTCLVPGEYTVGIAGEYVRLLESLGELKKVVDMWGTL